MGSRLDLQAVLVDILGSSNVYFQPPSNLQMSYPCIVYKRDDIDTDHADNAPYYSMHRYLVTSIDEDPDSITYKKIAALPRSAYLRNFVTDNLNHDVLTLYF
jgi:hypothetical protein